MQITRQVRIDLNNYNAGVERAMNEYAAHPIASCPYDDCYELLSFGERVCADHWRLLTEARDRMRARRRTTCPPQ